MAARATMRFARPMMTCAAIAAPMAAVWLGMRGSAASASPDTERVANTPPLGALSAKEFRPFKLLQVVQLTSDTARYTFELPRENDELGMTVASCLVVKAEVDGKEVVRPYTPTSSAQQRGTFDLIIKTYRNGKVRVQWWRAVTPPADLL